MERDPGASRGRTAVSVLLLAASGVLGALAFPKPGWAALAWVWLVPALIERVRRGGTS